MVIPRPQLGETTLNKAEGLRLTRFENGYQLHYDGNERLTQEIGFDGRVQHHQYAAAGFLVAHIEGEHNNSHQAKLNTTTFKRDALGRLLEKHSPD